MDTRHYLALVKRRHHIESDYALAKLLEVSRQAVSHWQAGRFTLGNRECFRVADLLGLSPELVVADIEAERAEKAGKDADAEWWKDMRKKLGGALAAAIVGVGISGPSPDANAATARVAAHSAGDRLCIMSTGRGPKPPRRKRRSALQAMRDALTFAPQSFA